MLLVIGFCVIAFFAWVGTTDVWHRNGQMVIGYITAIAVVVHVVAFILDLLGVSQFFADTGFAPAW